MFLQMREISTSEIAQLAPLFSPNTLETVSLRYFGVPQARVNTYKAKRREDMDGFKRDLLTDYRNTGHNTKVSVSSANNNKQTCSTVRSGYGSFKVIWDISVTWKWKIHTILKDSRENYYRYFYTKETKNER